MDEEQKPKLRVQEIDPESALRNLHRRGILQSLSVAYQQLDPQSRAGIREAHDARVRTAVADLEKRLEPSERMTRLGRSFPCLRNASGIDPFRAEVLDRWAMSGISHGERVTASFLLAVWDSSVDWQCGRFDLMESLRIWPDDHREVFLRWAFEPWWP